MGFDLKKGHDGNSVEPELQCNLIRGIDFSKKNYDGVCGFRS